MIAPHRIVSSGFVPSVVALAATAAIAAPTDPIEPGFAHPPQQARLRAYWWWLNGNVTKAAITRDLEEMAAKGFGRALIFDAGDAAPAPKSACRPRPRWSNRACSDR